ncbi:hypothetical protein HATV-3_gp73 [Haloarcula tailed virus 3]|uniref:Uncharacterized protein n=1 Tax=Haloarcula tailed virus 3 TaxID=2877990 RepID=A0AAE9BYR3_9CAUD|nr:hypothetical protein M1M35_gp73 [Haloarcula tailed virus 3]UBF23423.1 hypothetical protein HATV-3_gp73 [Haloarcula tailed virus 3]
MARNIADELETGDKLTMDGLKICEVVDTEATRGLGGTREGIELRDVEKDGEDDVFFKTARQIDLRWTEFN